jgi:DNA-binding NarL/FixJ family response regulator
VARRLEISVKTVESHVSAVLRKLQLSSRHELARWATDRRIV